MQNGLQLNPDKSEAQYSSWEQSTSYTGSASSLSSVKVALLRSACRLYNWSHQGTWSRSRPAFDVWQAVKHVSCGAVVQLPRTGHIRHLLNMDLAQTLANSLILSRIDYCNTVLHGAPSGTMLQRVYRTTPQESFIKRQDDHMHTRCWRNCIGCRWSSASPRSWPYWRSIKIRHTYIMHRRISAVAG